MPEIQGLPFEATRLEQEENICDCLGIRLPVPVPWSRETMELARESIADGRASVDGLIAAIIILDSAIASVVRECEVWQEAIILVSPSYNFISYGLVRFPWAGTRWLNRFGPCSRLLAPNKPQVSSR